MEQRSVFRLSHGRAFFDPGAQAWIFRVYREGEHFAERMMPTNLRSTAKPETVRKQFERWVTEKFDHYMPDTALDITVEEP
jgi:hypothetical protein